MMIKKIRIPLELSALYAIAYLGLACSFATVSHAEESHRDEIHPDEIDAVPEALNLDLLYSVEKMEDAKQETPRVSLRLQADKDQERLSFLRPSVTSFVIDCAELEAIPLVELGDDKENASRVFFGISFDGVLGFHGRLF